MIDAPVSLAITAPVLQDTKAPEVPFEYAKEKEVFFSLYNETEEERRLCAVRRELRRHKKNVADLRTQGLLLPDETIIPDRTIEQNIAAEKPPYIAFIEQPQTTISFVDSADPTLDTSEASKWITDLLRYQNWKDCWLHNLDAMLLHGASFIEGIFDPAAPSKFTFEYVRRDSLLIPKNTRVINNCTRLARMHEVTKAQLQDYVKTFGFDETAVRKITEHYKSKTEFIRIFKYFMKDDNGAVYTAWLALDEVSLNSWLREPRPYYNGDFSPANELSPTPTPIQATSIPIFDFPYVYEEDETILQTQGQAALSVHIQEALTGLYSATVNGATRAAGIYATEVPDAGGNVTNAESIPLKSGFILKGNLAFANVPWPNAIALQIAQALSVRNAQQSGQTDYAAMSRQDTAKRATEIVAAKEESDKLKSTKISLWSERSLLAYKFAWNVIKNQVLLGTIQPPPTFDFNCLLSPTITVVMSADAQVVRKESRKNTLLNFWPIVSTTPYAPVYLDTLLIEIFPADFPKWQAQLGMNNAKDQLLSQTAGLIQATPPAAIPPQLQQDYANLLTDIAGVLQPPSPDGTGGVAGPSPNGGPPPVPQPA